MYSMVADLRLKRDATAADFAPFVGKEDALVIDDSVALFTLVSFNTLLDICDVKLKHDGTVRTLPAADLAFRIYEA